MSTVAKPSPTCSQVKSTGARCAALALTGSRFCYAHSRAAQRRLILRDMLDARRHHIFDQPQAQPISPAFDDFSARLLRALDIPAIEDATSLNIGLNAVRDALATQQISERCATLLLRAFRLQNSILDAVKAEKRHTVFHPEESIASDPDPLRHPYEESIRLDEMVEYELNRLARSGAEKEAQTPAV